MKIKVAQITFPFSESGVESLEKAYSNWSAAEVALARIKPPKIGYYKTDFRILYEDGEVYKGRYDIGSDAPTLREHILGFVERAKDKHPEYQEFAEKYQIG